jgi:polysaccharide export outer membrane protein
MATKLIIFAFVSLMFAGVGNSASYQSQPTNYVVGPQDILTVTSFDQEDLSGKYPVDADGTFTFPLVGRVRAGGLTLRQLEA